MEVSEAEVVKHLRDENRGWGSARDWAIRLGLSDHAETLQKTLDGENHADKLLSQISRSTNAAASTTIAA